MTFDDRLSVFSAARDLPDGAALLCDGRTLTWRDLAAHVAGACDALSRRGAGPGVRVAVRAQNRVDTVVTLLALVELGATTVLVHPRLTPDEAQRIVDDAAVAFTLDGLDAWTPRDAIDLPRAHDPASPLAMLYTSGTTGRPKGAVLSRAAFMASADASAQNLGWRDDDRWLLCLPVCHIGGFSVLTRCVMARRTVVLRPRFDADDVLRAITETRATLLSVVPTMLKALLDADATNALATLRAVLVGGAGTPPSLLARCVERGVRALTTYGLTEACSQVTTQRPLPEGAALVVRPDSGHPLAGVEVTIRDEHGALLPHGDVGRIWVRGPSVMTGYWGQPPLAGWLDTGDLGSFGAEQSLTVHTRRTDLVVTGGENVYPIELEHRLSAMKGVSAALVFGAPDETWGQVVCAAIVRDRTISPELDDGHWLDALGAEVATALAPHKRPRRVCVVDALPTGPTGKIDRAGAVARFTPRLAPWRATSVTRR